MADQLSARRVVAQFPHNSRVELRPVTDAEKVEAARQTQLRRHMTPREMMAIADVIKKNMSKADEDVELDHETVEFISRFPDSFQSILWREAQNHMKGRSVEVSEEDVRARYEERWASQRNEVEVYRNEAVLMLDEAARVMEDIDNTLLSWRVRPKRIRDDGLLETDEQHQESVRLSRSSDRHWALRTLIYERPGRLLIGVDDRVYPVQPPSGHHGAACGGDDDATFEETWAKDNLLQHRYFAIVDRLYGPRGQPAVEAEECAACDPQHEVPSSAAGCECDDGACDV